MTDERAFLTAIIEQPDDDLRKLAYADWLEERGDPRAEYLRLMMQVRRERVVTPEQRQRHQALTAELTKLRSDRRLPWNARPSLSELGRREQGIEGQMVELSRQIRQQVPGRLQELSATLDANWLAVVGDPEIEGCGKGGGAEGRLRFDFVCDKTWADLTPACDDQKVRHCETCCKNVHFCDTIVDAREHAREGHCIAVDLGIVRREGDLVSRRAVALGLVAPGPSRESRRRLEDDLDPVSQERLNART